MLTIRRLLIPLVLFPAATDLVYDPDDASVPVTLQCHLPPGVLDVEAMEERGELTNLPLLPHARSVLRLLA